MLEYSTTLLKSEKEELKERYNKIETLQEYITKLTDDAEISVVSVMRYLPDFFNELTSLEYTIFIDRYFKNYSIHEIVTIEKMNTYLDCEKVLKSIDKKIKRWMKDLV